MRSLFFTFMSKQHSFKAIIVGAGLGGLLLALQLERSEIEYAVIERNIDVLMPLQGGGVIFVQPVVQSLLAQLGLLDRVLQASSRVRQVHVKEYMHGLETGGRVLQYDCIAITRPELYNILVQQIPPAKLWFGKTVDRIEQDEQGVRCYCTSDSSSFSGDVLVGADGTYSAVRLHLLNCLREQDILSDNDRRPMQSDSIRLVGQTMNLDLKSDQRECNVQVAIHKGEQISYTTWAVTFPKGNVCWMIDQHLQEPQNCPELEDLTYHADWVEAMCDEFRALPSAWGSSVPHATFFNATPPNTIGRILRESKVYDAWHQRRIVLMGDACHKALPYWGHPLAQAALDSIALHKALESFARHKDILTKDVECLLEGYVQERMADARSAVVSSRRLDE